MNINKKTWVGIWATLLSVALLSAALLSVVSCAPPAYVKIKDGQAYGVTDGLFRNRWWSYFQRGMSYGEGQFWDLAEADFREAIDQRGPDQRRARTYGMHFLDYFPHRELGVALYHQGRSAEAIKELEESLNSEVSAKAQVYLDKARSAYIESQGLDSGPPEIIITSPAPDTLSKGMTMEVAGVVRDDTYVQEVVVNGQSIRIDLSAKEVPFKLELPLKAGQNPIVVAATDLTGKSSMARRRVMVDRVGPVIGLDNPTVAGGKPRLKGYAYDDSGLAWIKVNGAPLPMASGQEVILDHPVTLAQGQDKLVVEAEDLAGNRTQASITLGGAIPEAGLLLAMNDSSQPLLLAANQGPVGGEGPPLIELKGWSEDQTVFLEEAYLEGKARDTEGVKSLVVNGQEVLRHPGANIFFSHLAPLEEGENIFTIAAQDAQGNQSELKVRVERKLQKVREMSSRMTLALLPFERKGAPTLAGEGLEDILTNNLVERERFEVVERQRLEEVLQEQKLSQSDLADKDSAVRLGKIVAADGVVMGSVLEKENSLEILARVVDPETSLVMATVDVYGEEPDLEVVQKLCQGLTIKLTDEFPLLEGLVVKVKGQEIIVDLGKESGAKKGMRLILFKEGEPIVHPTTGKVLGADVEELGQARIVAVKSQMSTAEVLGEDSPEIEAMTQVITE